MIEWCGITRTALKKDILEFAKNKLLEERFNLVNRINEIDARLENIYSEMEKLA